MGYQAIRNLITGVTVIAATGCTQVTTHTPATFSKTNTQCYDRQAQPYTSVVDTHLHFRPFGGPAVPFTEVTQYLTKTGVLFANVYGIGQSLPLKSSCTYYLDCPGTPAAPSVKNDFYNAINTLEKKPKDLHLTLSMTFPDLSEPEKIVDLIKLYDQEFPNSFKWMGEVNLIKQALFNNHHKPATVADIKRWAPFMKILKQRNIPINIHSDLGSDKLPTKYRYLMQTVLDLYPDNKIVWAHMGLSREQLDMEAADHIKVMQSFLKQHPNLMLDISWNIIHENYIDNAKSRELYIEFFNQYSDRILPGTDFLASKRKDFQDYQETLDETSRINQYLNDTAFRNIALGENYFRLLNLDNRAPEICSTKNVAKIAH